MRDRSPVLRNYRSLKHLDSSEIKQRPRAATVIEKRRMDYSSRVVYANSLSMEFESTRKKEIRLKQEKVNGDEMVNDHGTSDSGNLHHPPGRS